LSCELGLLLDIDSWWLASASSVFVLPFEQKYLSDWPSNTKMSKVAMFKSHTQLCSLYPALKCDDVDVNHIANT
jgi:hypothetical protein